MYWCEDPGLPRVARQTQLRGRTLCIMRKPGTDENNVQMSDVLCDFCHREWTEDIPMVEGHHGSCICGKCLRVAYTEVLLNKTGTSLAENECTLCLEAEKDREALERGGEPGWQSPMHPEAAICRRCIKRAAGALHKDSDFDWTKPDGNERDVRK